MLRPSGQQTKFFAKNFRLIVATRNDDQTIDTAPEDVIAPDHAAMF